MIDTLWVSVTRNKVCYGWRALSICDKNEVCYGWRALSICDKKQGLLWLTRSEYLWQETRFVMVDTLWVSVTRNKVCYGWRALSICDKKQGLLWLTRSEYDKKQGLLWLTRSEYLWQETRFVVVDSLWVSVTRNKVCYGWRALSICDKKQALWVC